jgi:hypothetical protein
MANGSVYRRDDRKKPWIAHISWHEGDRRRQSKKSYATKREAQSALAEAIDAHRRALLRWRIVRGRSVPG